MESSAELRAKLTVYQGQLEQVHQLLAIDSSNDQFLSLKSDLEKVISLTEALFHQVLATENATKESGSNDVVETAVAIDAAEGSYSPGQADYSSDKDDLVTDIVNSKTLEQPISIIKPMFKVGDRIEVLGGARVFSGVVLAVGDNTECTIRYFEYPDSEVKLPISSLQPIPAGSYTREQVTIGMKCQCKFATDLQYYPVTVTGITQYGYSVTYTEYGNMEEVPLEYLRPTPSAVAENKPATTEAKETTKDNTKKDGLALIPIPDSLQVLPTDTEEEKRRKYKKIKSIKNKNHQIQQELQVKEVQQSWQKFVQKGTKRSLSGVVGTKSSIFSSTEDSSSKVGVVNSGRRMTQFGERKRFKFDSADGEAANGDEDNF